MWSQQSFIKGCPLQCIPLLHPRGWQLAAALLFVLFPHLKEVQSCVDIFQAQGPLGWVFGDRDVHLLTFQAFSNQVDSGELASGHQTVKLGRMLSLGCGVRVWQSTFYLETSQPHPRIRFSFFLFLMKKERRRIFCIWAKRKQIDPDPLSYGKTLLPQSNKSLNWQPSKLISKILSQRVIKR